MWCFRGDECGGVFPMLSVSENWCSVRLGVKPYACSMCDMRFFQRYHLERHSLTHTGMCSPPLSNNTRTPSVIRPLLHISCSFIKCMVAAGLCFSVKLINLAYRAAYERHNTP